MAGSTGWQNSALLDQIETGLRKGWLIYPGFVSIKDLPLIYSGARVFVYPSRYEGFGLPPLGAMASGVPPLIAGNTCLTAVAGDAALVIDPEDVEAFSAAIARALQDTAWRKQAIDAGIQHAVQYSWAKSATRTVDAYDDVNRNRT